MVPIALIGQLASVQHGVVARSQLLARGITGRVVDRLVRDAYLIPVHAGVFAVGYPPATDRARLMAAVLAGGEGSLIGHGCAAFVLGIDGDAKLGWIDVLVERGRCGMRRGIRYHRTRYLPEEDRHEIDAIPVTTVARTLRDSARDAGPWRLRRLFDEADRLGLLERDALAEILDRSKGHRGVRYLRHLLERYPNPAPRTRSPLEHRFFRIWEGTGLPMPEFNVRLCGFEVDCLWRRERLVVELDGYAYHHTGVALDKDEAKDKALAAAGYAVRHFTYQQVMKTPDWVVSEIRLALTLAGRHLPPQRGDFPATG